MSWNSPAIPDLEINKEQALIDARDIIREIGQVITIVPNEEQTVTRDKFNSIKKRNTVTTFDIYTFPLVYNPTDKQLEDSGIRERTQALAKTSVQDWIDNGYDVSTLKDLDSIRMTAIIQGAKYEIRDKQLDSQYQDTYLYIHLGLNRI